MNFLKLNSQNNLIFLDSTHFQLRNHFLFMTHFKIHEKKQIPEHFLINEFSNSRTFFQIHDFSKHYVHFLKIWELFYSQNFSHLKKNQTFFSAAIILNHSPTHVTGRPRLATVHVFTS